MEGFKYLPSAAKLARIEVVVVPNEVEEMETISMQSILMDHKITGILPILDPKVIGYAVSKVTSPAPQSGVKVDVKTDEDLTRIVITQPNNMAAYPVSHGTYGISALMVFWMIMHI